MFSMARVVKSNRAARTSSALQMQRCNCPSVHHSHCLWSIASNFLSHLEAKPLGTLISKQVQNMSGMSLALQDARKSPQIEVKRLSNHALLHTRAGC
jgi:hypothetical protein